MSLKSDLMTLITTALSTPGVSYNVAAPNAAYPLLTYSFVGNSQGNVDGPSFGADVETLVVQISAFDDATTGVRLLALMDTADSAILGMRSNTAITRITFDGGTGPTYLESQKEFRCTADYRFVLGRATPTS